jgi:hypothetical protein
MVDTAKPGSRIQLSSVHICRSAGEACRTEWVTPNWRRGFGYSSSGFAIGLLGTAHQDICLGKTGAFFASGSTQAALAAEKTRKANDLAQCSSAQG